MTQKQQESSDSLTGEEDEGEGAGRDGGWVERQGRAGWGRYAEQARLREGESTYRSRVGGGGAHPAVTAADVGHRF